MAKGVRKQPVAGTTAATEIQDIPHEDLPSNTPKEKKVTEAIIVTTEEKITMEVAKYDLPRATIAKWKTETEYLLNIDGTDKAAYKKLTEAVALFRGKRGAVKDKYDELTEEMKTVTTALRKERDELVDLLFDAERPLKAKKDEIDTAAEREVQRKEEELQKKLQGRVAALLENGMAFNGNYYAIGDTISMDVVTLKAMGDEAFEAFKGRVMTENTVIKEAAAAKEKERQEAEERLETQRKEQESEKIKQENERKELQRQRDELEREKADMKKQIIESRRAALLQSGFSLLPNGDMRMILQVSENATSGIDIRVTVIEDSSGDTWKKELEKAHAEALVIKSENEKYLFEKSEAKRIKEKKEEQQRLEKLALENRTKLRIQSLVDRFRMNYQAKYGVASECYIRKSEINNSDIFVLKSTVEYTPDEEWEAGLEVIQKKLDEVLEAEKQEEQRREKDRKEKEQKEKEEAEADRQLQLGDAEKLNEYFQAIRTVERPTLNDGNLSEVLTDFVIMLERCEAVISEETARVSAEAN